tara:strand:- start:439 stop:588 length:150 start_codon:yes stop_codon:yes gene_type:complete
MIPIIIQLLQANDFYNVSETVEIAKGKNEIVTNFTDAKEKIKRLWLQRK